jgi:hypothetical protein
MHKKNINAIFALLVLILLASCAKEGPTGPIGPAGPSYTGTIVGYVTLYDQYGIQVDTALTQVHLSLSGTAAITPTTSIASVTDTPVASGLYSFGAIATGNYTISATDSAYAYTIVNDFLFVSGTLNLDIAMSAIPIFSATSFTYDSTASGDSLIISFNPDSRTRNCIVFVYNSYSSIDTITSADYILAYKIPIPANQTTVSVQIPTQDLLNNGFKPGNAVYYTEFSAAVDDKSAYTDPNTGKKLYYAISHPNLISAIVP